MKIQSTALRGPLVVLSVVFTVAPVAAHAEEWVSVFTPPEAASSGMESFVDATSIEGPGGMRRATWRMVRWVNKAYADPPPPLPPTGVSYVIVNSTFDCAKILMRDEQTTMYYANGSNNAGAIGPSNWGAPIGATRAVFDFVCKARRY